LTTADCRGLGTKRLCKSEMNNLLQITLLVVGCLCGGFKNPVYRNGATNPSGYAENGVLYVVTDPAHGTKFDDCKAGEKQYIFPILKSSNLHDWELAAEGALDTMPAWAKSTFSGPGIYKVHGDRYNLYYAAKHKDTNRLSLGVAWSDSITGPFESDPEPLETKFSLNTLGGFTEPAFFYDDVTDTNFLVYNNNAGTLLGQRKIYIQNLTTDGRKTVGVPREILKTSVKWEEGVIESASLVKRNGWYYLFYSAAGKASGNNVIGVARADDVFGPYMKMAGPVMSGSEKFLDTGSTSVVVHNCSSDVLIYNAYPAGHKYEKKGNYGVASEPGKKMLMIDYITWDKGWPLAGWHGKPTQLHPHVYTNMGDGCCNGGRAMRKVKAAASHSRYECMESCEHDPICEGFSIGGCKDDPKCKGECYLYFGWGTGMSVSNNGTECADDGSVKCYKFDTNIASEQLFLMDDYTCARHMENLEVACVHEKKDCPRKRILDFETCGRHCNRNPECMSFIHDNQNNLCFLKKQTTQSGLVEAPKSYDAVLCAKEPRFRVGEYTCEKGQKTSDRCIGTCPVTVNSEDECAARCSGMGGCAAFHFNNRRECFLKGLPQEVIPADSAFGTRLCIKLDICAKGYIYMPGDVPGAGSNKFLASNGIDSAEECAEYCSKNRGCGSYEFSPSELKCNINTENEPTSEKIYKDYQFCSKMKTGKHAGFIRYEPNDVREEYKNEEGGEEEKKEEGGEEEKKKEEGPPAEAKESSELTVAETVVKAQSEKPAEVASTFSSAEPTNWAIAVIGATMVGFGVGYVFANRGRKETEYASLLGN